MEPKKNTAYVFPTALVDRITGLFVVDPVLQVGDVKVSKDGGAFANITTLPAVSPAGSTRVTVSLTAAEMNADNVVVQFLDVAGGQWMDQLAVIDTLARTTGELATQTSVDDIPSNAEFAAALVPIAKEATLADVPNNAELAAAVAPLALEVTLANIPTSAELDAALVPIAKEATLVDVPTNAELITALADLPTNAELDAALVPIAKEATLNATHADVISVGTELDELATTIGPNGSGLTAIGDARLAFLDAAVSSRLSSAGYTAPDNAGIAAIRAVTDALNVPTVEEIRAELDANSTELAGIRTDIAALNNVAMADIVAALDTALGTLNDISQAEISALLADLPTNIELAAALDTLNDLSPGEVRAALGLAAANVDAQFAAAMAAIDETPTAAELATALTGSQDAILAAIGTVSTLTLADVITALADLPTNAELGAALAATGDPIAAAIAALNDIGVGDVDAAIAGYAPATQAEVLEALETLIIPTPTAIADAVLTRDWELVSGEASRSLLNAMRLNRNKSGIAANLLTVTKEDDITPAWTAAITTAAGQPIVGMDPL